LFPSVSWHQLPRDFFLHALEEAGNVDHGSPHRPASDLLSTVVGAHAHDVEAAVQRLQFRVGVDSHSDPGGRAVFDVDGDSDRDFSLVAKRLQGVEAGGFHQPNHIWSRIDGRQLGVVAARVCLSSTVSSASPRTPMGMGRAMIA
jgi:hypothetical protein